MVMEYVLIRLDVSQGPSHTSPLLAASHLQSESLERPWLPDKGWGISKVQLKNTQKLIEENINSVPECYRVILKQNPNNKWAGWK